MTATSTSTVDEPAGRQWARTERRLVMGAFTSLFGILCAQALLETARDSLFLTHLPVERLPWLYLATAALTLIISGAVPGARRGSRWPMVSLSLLIGSALTAVLAATLGGSGHTPVYLLFLWSGIFSAFAVTQVWTVLAETVDMSNAKRLFGRLAAGGGLGAVAGSALARLLLGQGVEPRHLVWMAAAIAAATAFGPALALRRTSLPPERTKAPRARAVRGRFAHVVQHPYVARLLALTLLAAAVSTLLDYSFKETVVAHVSAERLPRFLATFHLATSVISLLVQIFGVGLVVRAVGVGRVQILFPVLLLLAVTATITTGGLAAVVILRGLDSALRSPFHRPTFEMLQVPLGDRLRRKAKPLINAFGQRGGQAIAGLALLLMFSLAAGSGPRLVAVGVLLAVWLMVALGLSRRYVDLLRSTLLHPMAWTSSDASLHPDGSARDTLVGALDSPRELEVRAAVDLLAAYGHARLINPRLLQHSSAAVVRRVIETLPVEAIAGGAGAMLATLDRLLGHPDVGVRKAAFLRRTEIAPDRALFMRLGSQAAPCPTLRAMALVVLVDQGWADVGPTLLDLRDLAKNGGSEVRLALAEALAGRPSPRLESILFELVTAPEPEVLAKAVATLSLVGGEAAIRTLVTLLGKREARSSARAALRDLGPPAFDRVVAALADFRQPLTVRGNAPRALVEIDPARSIGALLDGLLVEEDGFVRFRILRALNRVRRLHPRVAIDEDILGRAAVAATDSAHRYLAWRIFLQDGAARLPQRRTATWALLRDLLAEKEQNAVERLFRVLTLRYPHDGFRKLLRTLRVGGRRTRANGRELLENLLTGPAQALTLALIDDITDHEKLLAVAKGFPAGRPPSAPIYADLLEAICLEEEGGTLAALAAHHAAELGQQSRPANARANMVVAHA